MCGLSHIMADFRQIIWRKFLRSLCKYNTMAQKVLPHNVAWPFFPFLPSWCCPLFVAILLPIRRTKSPKAQFSGAALWIDGPWSPGRAVAMLFPRELQLGGGEFHARATGTTGQRDPWAKRLGADHRARRRCGPPHRADGQNGLGRGARSAYPPALEATGAQLGLDGGHMAGIYPDRRGSPQGLGGSVHHGHATYAEPTERSGCQAVGFQ